MGGEPTLRSFAYLVEDYDRADAVEPATYLKLIGGALRLSAHILVQDPDQLPSQLVGRLLGFEAPFIKLFLENVKEGVDRAWLRAATANLTPPGGPLLRTLTAHTNGVSAVAVTPVPT